MAGRCGVTLSVRAVVGQWMSRGSSPGTYSRSETNPLSGSDAARRMAEAASALKLTSEDLLANGIVDEVIPEPLGGGHYDPDRMAGTLK